MTNTHIDMNEIIQRELQAQRAKNALTKDTSFHAHISIGEEGANLNETYGPQQVESLLRYVVDAPLDKAFEDTEDDLDALHHLEALRGKKKKKNRVVKTY